MQPAAAEPIACTLGPDALGPREAWIRKVTDQHLVRHELTGRTLRLIYRPAACDELGRIVELERSCCAFLEFRLAKDAEGCELTIIAPEETDDAARWLFAQVLPGSEAPSPAKACGCGPGQCG